MHGEGTRLLHGYCITNVSFTTTCMALLFYSCNKIVVTCCYCIRNTSTHRIFPRVRQLQYQQTELWIDSGLLLLELLWFSDRRFYQLLHLALFFFTLNKQEKIEFLCDRFAAIIISLDVAPVNYIMPPRKEGYLSCSKVNVLFKF